MSLQGEYVDRKDSLFFFSFEGIFLVWRGSVRGHLERLRWASDFLELDRSISGGVDLKQEGRLECFSPMVQEGLLQARETGIERKTRPFKEAYFPIFIRALKGNFVCI